MVRTGVQEHTAEVSEYQWNLFTGAFLLNLFFLLWPFCLCLAGGRVLTYSPQYSRVLSLPSPPPSCSSGCSRYLSQLLGPLQSLSSLFLLLEKASDSRFVLPRLDLSSTIGFDYSKGEGGKKSTGRKETLRFCFYFLNLFLSFRFFALSGLNCSPAYGKCSREQDAAVAAG